MKTKYTEVELQTITEIQQSRGISRKSAMRAFEKQRKAATTSVVDSKKAAANDKPEVVKVKAVAKTMTPEERGKARAEGLRLFKLAGKPKKAEFVKVFGKKGPAMTWVARAEAAGLASAEEVAEKFPRLLAKAAR
jgi:hypothetical protein